MAEGTLLALLKDENAYSRLQAANAVWDFNRNPEALSALTALLREKTMIGGDSPFQRPVRTAAAEDLAKIGPAAAKVALPSLKELLKDEDKKTQIVAASTLCSLGAVDDAAQVLIDLVADDDENVQLPAIDVVSEFRSHSKVFLPLLAARLKADRPHARWGTALAIAEIGGDAAPAEPALRTLLKDEDEAIRLAADEAIYNVTKPPK